MQRGRLGTATTRHRLALSVLVTGLVLATTGSAPAQTPAGPPAELTNLETDGAASWLGIDNPDPRLSWQLTSQRRGVRQSAYQVLVASAPELLVPDRADVWDSGMVSSSEPWADYRGTGLTSTTRYFWTARAWVEEAGVTAWAPAAWFETAMMDPSDWKAEWITRALQPGEKRQPAECNEDRLIEPAAPEDTDCAPPSPILRTEFEVDGPVAAARLYASGLGYGVYHLNGTRVGDLELSPSFTDYDERVFYVTHDVGDLLREGRNALGVELGRGFYSMTDGDAFVATRFSRAAWHDEPKVRLELHVTYADGSTEVVRSTPAWKAATGPTVYDHLLLGEIYDGARAAQLAGWTEPEYDDSAWSRAAVADAPAGTPTAEDLEPERVTERLRFKTVTEVRPGTFVFDLGQNVAGWTKLRVRGNPGDEVTLIHHEKLNADGSVTPADNMGPQFPASQMQVYRLAGTGGWETYRPQFVYHGFQYVQVTGWPAGSKPTLDDLTAEVVHNDLRRVGEFSASNPLLDRIVRNMSWAIRQNAHAMVTDTPVYEKTGWLTNLEFPSWSWLFDNQRFHRKWSVDMEQAQFHDGGMPYWAPHAWPYENERWPNLDVALFGVPWDLHLYHGDARSLADRYDAMGRYLKWFEGFTEDGLYRRPSPTNGLPNRDDGLGDWARPGNGAGVGQVPVGIFNTVGLGVWADANAWWFHMNEIQAEAAELLGRPAEAKAHRDKADQIRVRFNETFLDRAVGRYRDPSDPAKDYSQHVNAMSLELGLVPADMRQRVADSLAADVVRRGHHLDTGSIGIRFLWPALSRNGHLDTAVRTATQTTYPSYGYWIDELGWTSLGEFWEESSRSRSHHFQGTIVQWFFEGLAGIAPLEPGFERIEFRPEVPAEGLDWVSASSETVRGPVASSWRKADGFLELQLTVPAGSSGVVHVPGRDAGSVTESGQGAAVPADEADGVRLVGVEDDRVVYEVGSGEYVFRVPLGS